MAAGDRAAGDIADDVAGAAFMRRIAGGKMRGNGIGGYGVTRAVGCCADGSLVKSGLLCAVGGVAAGNKEHIILTKRARQIRAFQRIPVKPDHQQADTPANPLDHRICGKGCR